ncbi:MAG: flagellar basal body P-ring formation chaperone FlgA [Pseudomonadota bacterium]
MTCPESMARPPLGRAAAGSRGARFAPTACALAAAALFAASAASAEDERPPGSLVAARAIVVKSVIEETDVRRVPQRFEGAASELDSIVGLEARVTIYAGRPILPGDLRPPALVERNEIVRLRYRKGPLDIRTEARALDRGALGDRVRVMNLESRMIVSGVVDGEHAVTVRR